MYLLSASYGNDSIAMIQFAHEKNLDDVHVIYCDTGWAADGWLQRIEKGEKLSIKYGFTPHRVKAEIQFSDLMKAKKGFPSQKYQWCSGFLKGLPFLDISERIDPEGVGLVMIGKRRDESEARKNTPEFIENSKYHGNRRVWHPLFLHDQDARNLLINKTGIEVLDHRSDECFPCVNSNRQDIRRLTAERINSIEFLEQETGQTMFRPAKHGGGKGIREVHKWACYGRGKYKPGQNDLLGDQGCGSPFGCGI